MKYFSLSGNEAPADRTGGVTFDAGMTVTVLPKLSIAVVGTNLRDLHNSNASQGIGYGIALIPMPDLVIVADGWTRFTPDNQTGRKGTSVMVGGDLTVGGEVRRSAGGRLRRRDPQRLRIGGLVAGIGGGRHRRGHPSGHPRTRRVASAPRS